MKYIITLSMAIVLLAVGCSKKEGAATLPQFKLARGDVTSASQIFTNQIGTNIVYMVDIHFSSAKAAELLKFAQQHPGQQAAFVVGSQIVSETMMPKNVTEPPAGLGLDCDTFSKAKALQDLATN